MSSCLKIGDYIKAKVGVTLKQYYPSKRTNNADSVTEEADSEATYLTFEEQLGKRKNKAKEVQSL